MKFEKSMWVTGITLVAPLAIPVGSASQNSQPHQAHQYQLVDMGTFSGPQSAFFSSPVVQNVNNGGVVAGGADTDLPDPFHPNCFFDCYIMN